MARDCPIKKTKVCSAEITKGQVENEEKAMPEQLFYSVQQMIMHAAKFSDEEQSAFIQGLNKEDDDDQDLGFLEA